MLNLHERPFSVVTILIRILCILASTSQSSGIIASRRETSGSIHVDLLLFLYIMWAIIGILTGKFIGIQLLRKWIENLNDLDHKHVCMNPTSLI